MATDNVPGVVRRRVYKTLGGLVAAVAVLYLFWGPLTENVNSQKFGYTITHYGLFEYCTIERCGVIKGSWRSGAPIPWPPPTIETSFHRLGLTTLTTLAVVAGYTRWMNRLWYGPPVPVRD